MSRLTLNFLGTPEVRYDGRPIAFPTRKALALLIYLAVEGQAQPRDKLAALLWPDSPGASTLRSTLTMLRKALGTAASSVVADRDSLRFDLTPDVDFDLRALQTASQRARQLPMTNPSASLGTSHQAQFAQLASSAPLIRGDFLEGFSLPDAPEFDTWASVQREALHRQAMAVFDGLSQLQFDRGELAEAIETAARWAALDPLDEAAHRRLMLCHFTLGDRSAALQAYEACRALLKRELNVEPSPETEILADHIRTQSPPTRESEAGQIGKLPYEAPLVGRANEHAELVAAYRSARQGHTQMMLIEGEPGIGKTRLAKEFLAWASAQGAIVLQGRAFEMGSQVPYQVVVDALRSSNLQSLFSNLSSTWLAELTLLLPELHDLIPNLPPPLPLAETESRSRLFEAVARTVQTLAETAPAKVLVLFVDDLQWADAASLDLLAYAARRWAANHLPALLIIAARSEDMAQLDPWLTHLSRDLPLTRQILQPLSFDDILKLTGDLQLGAEAAAQLFADTKGHPFFILQILNALSESDEHRPSIPAGIRDLIRSRLGRLTPNASLLCAVGAVFGAGFDFGQLCRIAEVTEGDGLPALEELLRRGLLRETPGRLHFSHDWIREVAYADLSETRRRIWHRRALEAEQGMPLADQARHALAAGLLDRAFDLCLAAGDQAMRVLALGNAIALYEQASVLLTTYQPPSAELHALYFKLGRAFELSSKWAAAQTAFQELLRLAREAQDSGFECLALIRLSAVAAGTFDLPAATKLLGEAGQIAERREDKARLIEIELNLAEMGVYRWNADDIAIHGERGLALARELGQTELAAHCLNRLAYGAMASGQWEAAETRAAEARSLYAQLGSPLAEAECRALAGAIQCQSGRLREGIEEVQRAYQVCRDLENDWGQANSASHLAHGLGEAGEYGQALTVARAGVAAARASGHPPQQVSNLTELGRVYRELSALDEARTVHAEALTLAEILGHPWLIEVAAGELCADCVWAGDWAEALVRARRAVALREADPTIKLYASLTLRATTEAMLRGNGEDVARAIADVQRCGERVAGKRRYRLPHLRALAVLAQRKGKSEEAEAKLREAASIAESIGLPGELWPIYAALGENDRAAEVLQALAANFPDEQLRISFLAAASQALETQRCG
jgi:DNA-binding SARP family transcriptional activator